MKESQSLKMLFYAWKMGRAIKVVQIHLIWRSTALAAVKSVDPAGNRRLKPMNSVFRDRDPPPRRTHADQFVRDH
jgi:hypothetical protein